MITLHDIDFLVNLIQNLNIGLNQRAYNVLSENTTDQVSLSKPENESTGFTSAQCQQLMSMIQSGFKELSANASFSFTGSQWNAAANTPTHMAGNV